MPPHNLPTSFSDLVGREKELETVQQLLQEKRLVTLVGPGGVGKSCLALQVAWQSLSLFRQGVYLILLAPVSSPELMISAIAEALEFSFYGHEDPKLQLIGFLRAKEMLLVMDNLEHLLTGAGLLTEILQQAAGVKILATSRERLNLYGEWVFEVQGLRFPRSEADQEIENYSAVRLFLHSAQRAWAGFSLVDQDRLSVGRICRLVGGLPLAIELAANWVKALSCQEIATEIEKSLDFLVTPWHDVPERHHSLRAVFEHSWKQMTAGERQAFSSLSVFRGGFQRKAAGCVAGVSLQVLSSLVTKSFLHWNPLTRRYKMHEVLKQYAAEKLAQTPKAEEKTRSQHCEYFMDFLYTHQAALDGKGQNRALTAIGKEIGNVRLAWEWAVARVKAEQIERGLESLFRFYEISSCFQDGEKTFAQATTKLCRPNGPAGEKLFWKLLARQGVFRYHLGCYQEARELLRKSLKGLRALDDLDEMAFCLKNLADIAIHLGDYEQARDFLDQALSLARATQSRHLKADSLRRIGLVCKIKGDCAKASACYEQSLQLYREIGDQRGESALLGNLGSLCHTVGDYDKARAWYKQSLDICGEIGDRQGKSKALINLGACSIAQGDYDKAKTCCEQALCISREIGDRWMMAAAFHNLGGVSICQGDYVAAQVYYDQVLRINREAGHRTGESGALTNLGLLSIQLGCYNEAKIYLGQALGIHREGDERINEGYALAHLALLFHHLGDNEVAQDYGHQALQIAQELGIRPLEGLALTYLGCTLEGQGRLVEAAEAYQRGMTLQQALGKSHLAMEALAGLARISLAQENSIQAQAQVEEILSYLQTRTLAGTEEPLRIYWTCYRVLRANPGAQDASSQPPRAQAILNEAHNLLQERASRIKDESLRRSFLENVIVHRDILREFAKKAIPQPVCSAPAPTSPPLLVEPLTERQKEVLHLIVAGLTNQEIARRLVISLSTVKYHVWHIYGKLGVRNRARAIKRARELGLAGEETSSEA